jgi:hypothetical protein
MAASQHSTTPTHCDYASRFWQLKSLANTTAAALHSSDRADDPELLDISYSLAAIAELVDRFALEAFDKPTLLEVSNGWSSTALAGFQQGGNTSGKHCGGDVPLCLQFQDDPPAYRESSVAPQFSRRTGAAFLEY